MSKEYLSRIGKPDLAYVYSSASVDGQSYPLVFFCGGFRSDMEGMKATYLEEQCRARGQAYVRFDYSGHGSSGGKFVDGTIGAWLNDALDIFDHLVEGSAIVVGSSMGGWIALLLALARTEQVRGVVGIAAAPDFTRGILENLNDQQRLVLGEQGYFEEENEYSDEPYIFTKALLEGGEAQCLLAQSRNIHCPVYLLQGKADPTVHWKTALKIQQVFGEDYIDVLMIDDGDHSLSRSEDLLLIDQAVCGLLKL